MDDTIALIRKSHDGDKKAREELVEKNIGLTEEVQNRKTCFRLEALDCLRQLINLIFLMKYSFQPMLFQ